MLAKLSAYVRWPLVILMIVIAALFMLDGAQTDSAITDERAHIPAGYGYVSQLDYRLNPEHPPIVKILAGAPLLFLDLNFPTDHAAWQRDVNGQWTMGTAFLYESGNDADQIIFWSRMGPILLTLLLIILTYLWAKELIGRWWALLPTFLVAFSPTVLAHGHYVTTDIGAALGIFISIAAFVRFLHSPSKKRLMVAGLAFGVAQLLKYSAFLLVPYFLLLIGIFYVISVVNDWRTTDPAKGHFRRFAIRFYRYFKSVFAIFAIGYLLVFLIYIPFTLNYPASKQVADTEFQLSTFTPRFLVDTTARLAEVPVARGFAEYVLGLLMVSQRAVGGNTTYFLGEVTNQSWWYYFPLTFVMKEPVASLILIFLALLFTIWAFFKSTFRVVFRRSNDLIDYLTTHFAEFSMGLFILVYWVVSMRGNLNIGVRHILPTLPFIYILTAGAIKNWFSIKNLGKVRNFAIKIFIVYQELTSISIKSAVLGGLLIWYFVGTLIAAPFLLSYFNIFFGGVKNGYQYVVDSNYDWGQDLKRLQIWADENLPEGEKIAVDYFGGGDAKYYLGEDRVENWWSARGSPLNEDIKWLAVSIGFLQGAKGELVRGYTRSPEDEYRWLDNPYEPYARAGTSIFIYKLE